MDPAVRKAIYAAVRKEPFAQTMNMQLVGLELGYNEKVLLQNAQIVTPRN